MQMVNSEYQATVRSHWSEFSLRARPIKVQHYQAGVDERRVTEGGSQGKLEAGHMSPRYMLRYDGVAEDSIEHDVFVILMSYPEGQQRLLERLAEEERKQLQQNKKHTPKHSPSLGKVQPPKKSNKHRTIKKDTKSWSQLKKTRLKSMLAKYKPRGRVKTEVSKQSPQSKQILKVSDIYTSSDDGTDELESDYEQLGRMDRLSTDSDSLDDDGKCSSSSDESEIDEDADCDACGDVAVAVESYERCREGKKNLTGKGDSGLEAEQKPGGEGWMAGDRHLEEEGCFEDRQEGHDDLTDAFTKEESCGPLANLEDLEQALFGKSELSFLEMLTAASDVMKPSLDASGISGKNKHNKEALGVGTLVWGKFSKVVWWPGIIIQGPMAGQRQARDGWTWMMWFGDFKISEMRLSQVEKFTRDFRQKCQGKLSSGLESAIVQALQECCRRAGIDVGNYENVKAWGLQERRFTDLVQAAEDVGVDLFAPEPGMEFPPIVTEELGELRDKNERDLHDSAVENTGHACPGGTCLSCGKFGRQLLSDHPLFEGKVCSKCKDVLQETLLLLDQDGCNMFCVLCGRGEELFVCEEESCGRSFCVECIRDSLEEDSYLKVREMNPWLCFLCTMYSESSHGDLIPRLHWRSALLSFCTDQKSQPTQTEGLSPLIGPRQRLRVLSLCDGIAATLVAIQTLGLEVEAYYACETDNAAVQVVQFQQPNCVTNIGSIYELNKDKLQSLLPLDLVVCSLPCEDCNVNQDPDTGGFNGSGMILCKLLLVLKDIQVLEGLGSEPFWLLTTPATLTTDIKTRAALLFQSLPSLWDAEWFSPLHCPVFVWGNLPHIHSSSQYIEGLQKSVTLDSCLVRNLDRIARVSKLRLCAVIKQGKQPVVEDTREATTSTNPDDDVSGDNTVGLRSNLNGSGFNFIYPVLMDNKPCGIWTIEIERALGLPDHYTDISRLGIKERMFLLKQTPSIPLLRHLLAPLTKLFAVRQE